MLGHVAEGLHFAVITDVIGGRITLKFSDGLGVGHTDLLLAGQQQVNVSVLLVGFKEGLLLRHGFIVEAIDVDIVTIHIVSAIDQLAQVAMLQKADGSVQML